MKSSHLLPLSVLVLSGAKPQDLPQNASPQKTDPDLSTTNDTTISTSGNIQAASTNKPSTHNTSGVNTSTNTITTTRTDKRDKRYNPDDHLITCYDYTGHLYPNNTICPHSNVCCAPNAVCLSNKLCHNPGDDNDVFVRPPCAMRPWDGTCALLCRTNTLISWGPERTTLLDPPPPPSPTNEAGNEAGGDEAEGDTIAEDGNEDGHGDAHENGGKDWEQDAGISTLLTIIKPPTASTSTTASILPPSPPEPTPEAHTVAESASATHSLDTGAIIGIILGGVFGVVVLVAILGYFSLSGGAAARGGDGRSFGDSGSGGQAHVGGVFRCAARSRTRTSKEGPWTVGSGTGAETGTQGTVIGMETGVTTIRTPIHGQPLHPLVQHLEDRAAEYEHGPHTRRSDSPPMQPHSYQHYAARIPVNYAGNDTDTACNPIHTPTHPATGGSYPQTQRHGANALEPSPNVTRYSEALTSHPTSNTPGTSPHFPLAHKNRATSPSLTRTEPLPSVFPRAGDERAATAR